MGPVGSHVLRRTVSEGLGTALLLSTIVGSGIMGSRLSDGDAAMTLLVNSLATGLVLSVLVVVLAPLSGAHLNPAVTLLEVFRRRAPPGDLAPYMAGQILGGFVGVVVAHLMFGEQAFEASHHARNGAAQLLSEFVATFGLFTVLRGTARRRPEVTAMAVGGYITAAYWFTASTAFANPAVTLARCATDTFAGIRPRDVPGFIMAQLLGAAAATSAFSWLDRNQQEIAEDAQPTETVRAAGPGRP
jgi:glycerol uptake facilitator-like aquaporin